MSGLERDIDQQRHRLTDLRTQQRAATEARKQAQELVDRAKPSDSDEALHAVVIAQLRCTLFDRQLVELKPAIARAESMLADIERDRQQVAPRLAAIKDNFRAMFAPSRIEEYQRLHPLDWQARYDEVLDTLRARWAYLCDTPLDEDGLKAEMEAGRKREPTIVSKMSYAYQKGLVK